ncbi:MAG TPA: hypothetical protein VKS01_09655, partial [Bryobacteraceae bacterium]|nr:hypothetical protein [Bryobacteraceae bacterium]
MASRKEPQRILSRGLNLLPPSDKIDDGEAILLDNWRVDQVGQLRSRKGSALVFSGVGTGFFHTLARAGADRYMGIGTDLWHGTPANPTNIAPGAFDGNTLGIAFYQGAGWMMNRNKQLRVVGSATQNWGVAPPAAAPSVEAINNVFTAIEEWESTGTSALRQGTDVSGPTGDDPSTDVVATTQGTVTVTIGSAAVVGAGTNWDQTMVDQTIDVQTTDSSGGLAFFGAAVAAVA